MSMLTILSIVQLILYSSFCLAEENIPSYDDRVNAALKNPYTFIETVSTSSVGSTIAGATGTISAVSSALIMLILLRSNVGLSSIYHRLMFGMSLADILASIAMALTTSPLPMDNIYSQFESKPYGNRATCTSQGFFFTFGNQATFMYNTALCVYYLCSIRFKMKDAQIRRHLEPTLHFISLSLSLTNASLFAFGDLYHPTPLEPWCTSTLYPWHCGLYSVENKEACMIYQSNRAIGRFAIIFIFGGFMTGFFVLVFSMISIVWSVYQQEAFLKSYLRRVYGGQSQRELAICKSRHQITKVISIQALAYLAAFFICQGNVFVSLFRSQSRDPDSLRGESWNQIYHLVTRPLQGFFNLLVFVGHKAYNLRRIDPNLSTAVAILRVFTVREEPEFIFSQISLVKRSISGQEDEFYFDGDDDDDEKEKENDGPPGDLTEGADNVQKRSEHRSSHEDEGISVSETFADDQRLKRPTEIESSMPASWFSLSSRASRQSAAVSWDSQNSSVQA